MFIISPESAAFLYSFVVRAFIVSVEFEVPSLSIIDWSFVFDEGIRFCSLVRLEMRVLSLFISLV